MQTALAPTLPNFYFTYKILQNFPTLFASKKLGSTVGLIFYHISLDMNLSTPLESTKKAAAVPFTLNKI